MVRVFRLHAQTPSGADAMWKSPGTQNDKDTAALVIFVARTQPLAARAEGPSAFDDVERKTGQACFLVARLHIEAGQVHGADHLVERDLVTLLLVQRDAGGMHGLYGAHRVALDAGNLHQAANRVA